jgi:hypothetical protein
MSVVFLPVRRLVDQLSRQGFRVSFHERSEEEKNGEFFVSRRGKVVGMVTGKWGKAVTVTYGKPDRQLLAIARRYGDVFSGAQRSPELPFGAEDVTGKAMAQVRLQIAVALIVVCLFYLAKWWFGFPDFSVPGG